MSIRKTIRRLFRGGSDSPKPTYAFDGLSTIHDSSFMHDPAFVAAYQRGVKAAGKDYHWYWRVHVGLWAARHASNVPGDFVECGVNRGFMSSAIMQLLDWDSLGKTFHLFDTFAGMDEALLTDDEKREGYGDRNRSHLDRGFYVKGVDSVRANFAEWKNVRLIEGTVPQTLDDAAIDQVAFLHLDMNCAAPEVAAAEHFWPLMSPGAVMLMDDYCYQGYEPQHKGLRAFAEARDVMILSAPTGQGVLLKP